jgi:hypothetical protein
MHLGGAMHRQYAGMKTIHLALLRPRRRRSSHEPRPQRPCPCPSGTRPALR